MVARLMARVRFIADFDYKPTRAVTVAYKAGMQCLVKRHCADQAIAAGKAVDFFKDREPVYVKDEIGG
jgi:hypothetical protein